VEVHVAKIVVGLATYKGPDPHAFRSHLRFHERLGWLKARGEHDIFIATQIGNSLISMARDAICDEAVRHGADWIFMYDDDMVFEPDILERLMASEKDVIVPLAFTSRWPVGPVLWKILSTWDAQRQAVRRDLEPILDYPRNALFRVQAVGTGVVLIHRRVLERIPRPWFHGGVNVGEDVYFCLRCQQAGVEVWCDSRVKTLHKPNEPLLWHDERLYDLLRCGQLNQVLQWAAQQREEMGC
jgi:hypothetical protein